MDRGIVWVELLMIIGLVAVIGIPAVGAVYEIFFMPINTTGEVTSVQTMDYIVLEITSVDFFGGNTDRVFGTKPAEIAERGDTCTMKSQGYFLKTVDCE